MLIQIDDFIAVDYTNQSESFSNNINRRPWNGFQCGHHNHVSRFDARDDDRFINYNCGNRHIDTGLKIYNNDDDLEDKIHKQTTEDLIDQISEEEGVNRKEIENLFGNKKDLLDLKRLKDEVRNVKLRNRRTMEQSDDEDLDNPNYQSKRDAFIKKLQTFILDCGGESFENMSLKYGEEFTNKIVTTFMQEGYMCYDEDDKLVIYEDFILEKLTELEKDLYYNEYLKL